MAALKRWKLLPYQQFGLGISEERRHAAGPKKRASQGTVSGNSSRTNQEAQHARAAAYFASLLVAQGTPISEVSSYLGHADSQITLKIYTHWLPTTKTDSISRLAGMVLNAKSLAEDPKTEEVSDVAVQRQSEG